MEKDYVPKTLEECYTWINTYVPDADEALVLTENTFVVKCHHTLGRWMRNNWGLWRCDTELSFWFMSLGIKHADDMSGIITTSYWRHINEQPIDIESQVKRYIDFWNENGNQFPIELDGIG